ncbi:hypothetical protein [Candidatus Ichthyocystis hellenicum]|uniref:hypothetical protein n=1 Tax=Candidatus Ichthyocystis hellenicum TaxID=1561003 RepID=UPI000B805F37|nr:hypothetical protein [Candidatus Ichthyocystis hellenicum]
MVDCCDIFSSIDPDLHPAALHRIWCTLSGTSPNPDGSDSAAVPFVTISHPEGHSVSVSPGSFEDMMQLVGSVYGSSSGWNVLGDPSVTLKSVSHSSTEGWCWKRSVTICGSCLSVLSSLPPSGAGAANDESTDVESCASSESGDAEPFSLPDCYFCEGSGSSSNLSLISSVGSEYEEEVGAFEPNGDLGSSDPDTLSLSVGESVCDESTPLIPHRSSRLGGDEDIGWLLIIVLILAAMITIAVLAAMLWSVIHYLMIHVSK